MQGVAGDGGAAVGFTAAGAVLPGEGDLLRRQAEVAAEEDPHSEVGCEVAVAKPGQAQARGLLALTGVEHGGCVLGAVAAEGVGGGVQGPHDGVGAGGAGPVNGAPAPSWFTYSII